VSKKDSLARKEPVSPARARPQAELDAIIGGIMTDMCEGRWRTGASHRELSEQHGVTIAAVQDWASKAALVLRKLRGDADEVRDAILSGIEYCQKLALEADEDGRRDLKAALSALELRAKVFGVMAPTKLETTTTVQTIELSELKTLLNSMGYDIVPLKETNGTEKD
jgi:hypothetical protein